MSDIAGHFCGQPQSHRAHAWTTPPIFGATAIISTYQCAGTTGLEAVEAERERIATMIEAEADAPLIDDPSHYAYLDAARIARAGGAS